MVELSGRLSWVDATALTLGALLGVGVLYIPKRVENHAGPAAPLAFLLAAGAVVTLAVCYAVFLSGALGTRGGGAYLHLSRTWRSRALGFLVVWPKPAAYVALLALLASFLASMLPVAVADRFLAVGILGVVFLLHLAGPFVAGRVGTVVTGALVCGLLLVVVPGVTSVVPANYQPLFPTPMLSADPLSAVGTGAFVALFSVVGFDAAAGLAGVTTDARRTLPWALVAGVVGSGVLSALLAFVVLGIIPWSRMVFATAPVVDTAQSLYDVRAARLLPPAAALAATATLLALWWAPMRTLEGFGELLPPLAHTNRFGAPDVAAACVFGASALLVSLDVVWVGLFLVLPALLSLYLAHALTTAALPFVRPDLYETCTLRPPPRVTAALGVVAAAVAGLMLVRTLSVDSALALGYTRAAPLVAGDVADPLIRDPLRSVVPVLVGWETLGVLVYIAAGDYRAETGRELDPLTRL